jgi:hypothetical protein
MRFVHISPAGRQARDVIWFAPGGPRSPQVSHFGTAVAVAGKSLTTPGRAGTPACGFSLMHVRSRTNGESILTTLTCRSHFIFCRLAYLAEKVPPVWPVAYNFSSTG